MTNWREHVRDRFRRRGDELLPDDVVDELGEHLAEREAFWRSSGCSAETAYLRALAELPDYETLTAALKERRRASRYRGPLQPIVSSSADQHSRPRMTRRRSLRQLAIRPTDLRAYLDQLKQDIIYGCRSLAKAPAFTGAAVLTLSIGIGANAVIFSIVDNVLIRPLPFHNPDELVWVHGSSRETQDARVSPPDYRDFRRENRTFAHLAAMFPFPFTISGGSAAERINGAIVSDNFFVTLGVSPAIGRAFQSADAADVRGG